MATSTSMTSVRQVLADMIFPEGREERRSLERYAQTDPLTGLANRRALDAALPAAEADPATTVMAFDLNNLGRANKQLGHETGDLLIKRAADCIAEALAQSGFGERAFRRGGDEFVALAPSRDAPWALRGAEEAFGTFQCDGFAVTLTGTLGGTYWEADCVLQGRKATRKSETDD